MYEKLLTSREKINKKHNRVAQTTKIQNTKDDLYVKLRYKSSDLGISQQTFLFVNFYFYCDEKIIQIYFPKRTSILISVSIYSLHYKNVYLLQLSN